MNFPSLLITLSDEDATAALAQDLAKQPELANATLSLQGGLGAGKTTFTRHLLRALGATGRIKSPTYALVEPYEDLPAPWGLLQAWHFDFYRLQDPNEYEEAGLAETFATPGLKIVEWLEQVGEQAPSVDLAMQLEILASGERQAQLQAHSPRGAALLEGVRA